MSVVFQPRDHSSVNQSLISHAVPFSTSIYDAAKARTEDITERGERTVEIAVEEVLCESGARCDGESSAYDVVLYGRSAATNSKAFQSLQDLKDSPILLSIRGTVLRFTLGSLLTIS